jgi:hypothetical protein
MWTLITEIFKGLLEFFTKLLGVKRKAYCPACGQSPGDDAWRCVVCGRKPLCPDHYDPVHQCCQDCVAKAVQKVGEPDVSPRDLARIKRHRVRVMILTPTLIGVTLILGIAAGVTADHFMTVRRAKSLAVKLKSAATTALKQECYGRAYRLYRLLEAVDRREARKGLDQISQAIRRHFIFHAVRCGDMELIDAIVSIYPKAVTDEDEEDCHRTPLHYAAVVGNVAVAKFLLRHGADIMGREAYAKNTPLHLAAKYGQYDMARLLIEKGAEVNAVNRCGWTPMTYAARFSSPKVVDLLSLHNGSADPNKKQVIILAQFLRRCEAESEKMTRTPVCYQREKDEFLPVKGLKLPIADQAEPAAPASRRSIRFRPDTPLHVAAKYGSVQVVTQLLSRGARVNALNQQGHTPLYLAIHQCAARSRAACQAVAELLRRHGGKLQ